MPEKMNVAQTGVNTKIFLRKYRWKISVIPLMRGDGTAQEVADQFDSVCYMASRPKLTFQDQAINHVHEAISYPVRAGWEPLDLVAYHVAGDSYFWIWLQQMYRTGGNYGSPAWGYYEDLVRNVRLTMLNGLGDICEIWRLEECWPISWDFGDLDMQSTDLEEVRLSLKYARAQLVQINKPSGRAAQANAS